VFTAIALSLHPKTQISQLEREGQSRFRLLGHNPILLVRHSPDREQVVARVGADVNGWCAHTGAN